MVRAPGCIDDAVAEPDVASNHQGEQLMRRHPYASAMLGLPVTDNETETSSAPG
jgi:hypothetical protein